jgi:selenocysteine lyase/cysteine desulfurase
VALFIGPRTHQTDAIVSQPPSADTLRSFFPGLAGTTYLNNATSAPGAAPVVDAVRRAEDDWARGRFDWLAWEADAEATRPLFARLVGGRPEEVALVSSFAEAAAAVAASLSPGRVVVGSREFRSNHFPWLALARRGFDVVEVPAADGVVSTDAFCSALRPGTVLAAVSEVQSTNGFRARTSEIGARCRQIGARLFVDVTQSLGVLRFDAEACGADYVAAHGYKWLLAPRGASWLWTRRDHVEELWPLAPSWKSVEEPFADYYGGRLESLLASSARRLDGSLAWLSWVGARAALSLLASFDPDAVERRCLGLAASFRRAAEDRGLPLAPAEVPSQTLALGVSDPEALRARLAERGVIASVRGSSLRLGFHAYNDESDVATALEAIGGLDTAARRGGAARR